MIVNMNMRVHLRSLTKLKEFRVSTNRQKMKVLYLFFVTQTTTYRLTFSEHEEVWKKTSWLVFLCFFWSVTHTDIMLLDNHLQLHLLKNNTTENEGKTLVKYLINKFRFNLFEFFNAVHLFRIFCDLYFQWDTRTILFLYHSSDFS